MSIALNAQHLEKRYGHVCAVDDVTFAIGVGEVVGLIGPNGAGKTSTIRMVTGYLEPSGGRVEVAGRDVASDRRAVGRTLGYLPEHVPLYGDLRVVEYVDHRARLKGLRGRDRRRRVDAALDRLALGSVRRQLVGTLSKGYRQRVGLAAVLVNEPRVLVLDEPTVGLDPGQTRDLRGVIDELRRDRTVLISSHLLPELERVVDRVLLMHRGRLIADGTPEGLRETAGPALVEVEVAGDARAFEAAVRALPDVIAVRVGETVDGWCAITVEARADVRAAVGALLADASLGFRELHGRSRDLEAVFHRLTAAAEERDPSSGAASSAASSGPEASVE